MCVSKEVGDPGEIRTPDPVIRSHMLYPAELRGHLTTLERSIILFSNPQNSLLQTNHCQNILPNIF